MQPQAQQTYYDILDVSPHANDEDIKLAYRRLVLFWHPDRRIHAPAIAEENLKQVNEAYAHIKDKYGRAKYNQTLQLQNKMNAPYQSPIRHFWAKIWEWMAQHESASK